jgi:hypothetical protein
MSTALAAAAPAVTLSPSPRRNVLTWPLFGAAPPDPITVTVEAGTLEYAAGGPDGENALRRRVCAYLSVGATLQGVGELLAPILNAAPVASGVPPFDADDVAKALAVYNRGYATADTLKPGFRLTLPVEIDDATGHWIVQQDLISSSIGAVGPADLALLTREAQSLDIPEPEDLRDEVTLEIADAASTADHARDFAGHLVANPFDVVFRGVEILRQLRGDIYGDATLSDQEIPFVLGVLAQLRDYHLDQLAFGTAGNALLRRFWRALTTGDRSKVSTADVTAACNRVGTALGLAKAGSAWVEPTRWAPPTTAAEETAPTGPSVVPTELPLTPSQRLGGPTGKPLANGEPSLGRRGMALGRDLHVGAPKAEEGKYTVAKAKYVYRGPAFLGVSVRDPVAFAEQHATEIGTTGAPVFEACVRVATRIAGNEGRLDACRSADKGIVSTGMQQWSAHENPEMPVLLARFQKHAWDHYDLFFGSAGLLPRMCAKGDETAHPDDPAVIGANPDAAVSTFAGEYFPWYVTFDRLDANASPSVMKQPKDASDTGSARVLFFDGQVSGNTVEFGHDWCARVRLAGRCSTEYGVTQVQTAAYRFKRILDGPGGQPLRGVPFVIGGVTYHVPDLFKSEFAAAAILDQHINAPGNLKGDVTAAVQRALPPRNPPIDPQKTGTTDLDPHWLARFAVDYVALRHFDPSLKPDRDDRIVGMHDKGLSPVADPPTFQGWP